MKDTTSLTKSITELLNAGWNLEKIVETLTDPIAHGSDFSFDEIKSVAKATLIDMNEAISRSNHKENELMKEVIGELRQNPMYDEIFKSPSFKNFPTPS